jgi:hypothetical protein
MAQKLTAVLFPGTVQISENRPLPVVMEDWIDGQFNLKLTPAVKVPPSIADPSRKLIFKRIKGTEKFEFVGTTDREIKYVQMADFAFEPDNVETHIVGPSISRQTVPVNYNFDPNPAAAGLEAKESASQEGAVAFLRFRDEAPAPSQPTAQTLEKLPDESEKQSLNQLEGLFIERAIWQRASLEEVLGLPASDWRLGLGLRKVSYLFLDGPWRKCYVRLGYDPRKDPQARRLQMIDFRDPFLRANPGVERPAGRPDVHFRQAPINRSQLYQLCDIEDPGIEALLNGPGRMVHADPHTGWLTESELEAIRNQLKIRSESLRRI